MTNQDDQTSDQKDQILFSYYQDQWNHIRHHETQRTSISLQLLVVIVSLGGAYLGANEIDPNNKEIIRILISVIIIVLSLGGIVSVMGFKQSTRIHRKRAETARKEIGFLEECAKTGGNWPKHHLYFVFMFSMISISGLLLLFLALLDFRCAGV